MNRMVSASVGKVEGWVLFLEHAGHRALVFALFDGLTLVVFFFAAGYADDEFGITAFADEQSQRNYREAGLFARLFKLSQFFAGKQEFAVAAFGVVVIGAVEIFGDIHVLDPRLSVVDVAERVGQRGFALAYGFDFRPGQHKAGRECVGNGVVECGTPVFYVYFFEFHSALEVQLWNEEVEHQSENIDRSEDGEERHENVMACARGNDAEVAASLPDNHRYVDRQKLDN